MDISAIALQGLNQAQAQLEHAALRIAQFGAASGSNLDVVDLSTEMVALQSAKDNVAINIKVLQTAEEVQQNLIDAMA